MINPTPVVHCDHLPVLWPRYLWNGLTLLLTYRVFNLAPATGAWMLGLYLLVGAGTAIRWVYEKPRTPHWDTNPHA